jgi:hypothetical protein
MSWIEHHKESEACAARAHLALARKDRVTALKEFAQAAEAEERALNELGDDTPRTLGILGVSACALWYKAGELAHAANLAHRLLVRPSAPVFAIHQLRELLQAIWNDEAQRDSGVIFAPGQVTVSVKGGEVVTGGAPLDLILSKVDGVQKLFYRTAEFIMKVPLRVAGLPSKAIQDRCRPWLFQTVPGSYQFVVAIQKPEQLEMFPTDDPEPEALTEAFLSILSATGDETGEELKHIVPDEGYRQTFLKLTRNLAPTGKTFDHLEIRGPADHTTIRLSPEVRRSISEAIRKPKASLPLEGTEQTLRGVLRALHLDSDWLDVSVDGVSHHIIKVGEAIDDVIGPMVNHEVVVRVREVRPRIFHFVDIELAE